MLDFSAAPLPLVVLAIGNFFFSWAWYSPLLFAHPWMKAVGIDPGHQMTAAEKKKMPWLFLSGLVASLLVVYGMGVVVRSLGVTDFITGVMTGALIWVGFALTHSLNTLWEGRKLVVLVINNGLFLVTYAIIGGILAVWR